MISLFFLFFYQLFIRTKCTWINWQRERCVTDLDCVFARIARRIAQKNTGKSRFFSVGETSSRVKTRKRKGEKKNIPTRIISVIDVARESLLDKSNLFRFELSII